MNATAHPVENASDFSTEFRSFDASTLPAIPPLFVDTSWRNDICPTFSAETLGLTIWVDYPEAKDREFPEWKRFRVTTLTGHDDIRDLLETDSWVDVLAFIAKPREG